MRTQPLDDFLHRIKAVFPFQKKGSGGSRAKTISPAKLEAWIGNLSPERPIVCCEKINSRLSALLAGIERSEERYRVLETINEHLSDVFTSLESTSESKSEVSINVKKSISIVERALEQFAKAYADIVHAEVSVPKSQRTVEVEEYVRLAALRACQYAYRRVLLICRNYGDLTAEHWQIPVELYFTAAKQQFHDTALTSKNSESIARQLGRILLLVLADPHGQTHRSFEHTRFYVERYGHLARLCGPEHWTGENPGWFLVWPSSEGIRPLVHRGELDREAGHRLLLDTHPLLARLNAQREGLAQGVSPTRLGLPLNAREPEYVALLDRLHERWGNPPERKQMRRRAQPRADVVIGFEQIRLYMAHMAQVRRQTSDETVPEFPVSQWEIFDRSHGGMGLEHLSETLVQIEIGELLAIIPAEDQKLVLGIARRTRVRNSEEIELGVELLGFPGLVARFKPPQRNAKGQERPHVPIIFLPQVPRLKDGPGLIVPPDLVEPGTLIALPTRQGPVQFESAERSERFNSCELIRLRRVDSEHENAA